MSVTVPGVWSTGSEIGAEAVISGIMPCCVAPDVDPCFKLSNRISALVEVAFVGEVITLAMGRSK